MSNIEDKVNEMHGDIKVLISEFKAMNGSLLEAKKKTDGVEKLARKVEKATIRHGIYWAVLIFMVITILGFTRFWIVTKARNDVSMAVGAEGYRMSQMIYRDFNKEEL